MFGLYRPEYFLNLALFHLKIPKSTTQGFPLPKAWPRDPYTGSVKVSGPYNEPKIGALLE